MADPFLGQITMFGGNFAPRGWAFCNGQLLAISTNQSLFALLGTIYGGDGRTSFALPDLRGRTAIHPGSGVTLGSRIGTEQVVLSPNEMPAHTHEAVLTASTQVPTTNDPTGNVLAAAPFYQEQAPNSEMSSNAALVSSSGGGAHENMQPFLTLNYILALQGVFPSRN